jgi:hypothetical protein
MGEYADTAWETNSLQGLSRLGAERGNVARLAQHFVDLARMQFLGLNHLPGILLQHHRLAFHGRQQLPIVREFPRPSAGCFRPALVAGLGISRVLGSASSSTTHRESARWSITLHDGIASGEEPRCGLGSTAAEGGYEGPRCFTEAHLWMQLLLLLRADAGGPPLPAHSSAFMTRHRHHALPS